jgi:hypothetical protein
MDDFLTEKQIARINRLRAERAAKKIMGSAEPTTRFGEPIKRSAAEAVLTNPDLLKQIGAFTNPKNPIDEFVPVRGEFNISVLEKYLSKLGLNLDKKRADEQYSDMLGILARVIFDKKDFFPNRDTVRVLLSKKIPADFDYDFFWRLVSKARNPILTLIDNNNMKKIFSNWENKGKRTRD